MQIQQIETKPCRSYANNLIYILQATAMRKPAEFYILSFKTNQIVHGYIEDCFVAKQVITCSKVMNN